MTEFNLLIIEDDETVIDQYNMATEMINDTEELEIKLTIIKSLQQGLELLDNSYEFDAAIVDLRLSATNLVASAEGNILIKELKRKYKIPIFVHSGHTGDLEPELQDIANDFFKVITRGSKETVDIIRELIEIYSLGITKVFKNEGLINEYLDTIFWNYISPRLNSFKEINQNNPNTDIEKIILRFVIMHLKEFLEITSDDLFEDYHTSEMYIIPPIRKNICSGDIIKFDENIYVVLSPACELANNKNIYYNLAQIDNLTSLEKCQIPMAISNRILKYHFLPPSFSFNGGYINFEKIHSFIFNSPDDVDKIASISPNFLKDIINRFSTYYSRQGQPNFYNLKEVRDNIISQITD